MRYYVIVVALLLANYSNLAQRVKPALNLVKGSTYYMNSNANSTVVQTLNSQQNTINLSFSINIAFKVLSVADTVYNMEVSYQRILMKIQATGRSIEMDSKKNDTSDVPSAVLAAIVDKPFNIKLSKTGRVRSVENFDRVMNAVFDHFAKIDAAQKEQIKTQFMQSLGATAFKGSLEMGTAIFPSSPVLKNEKWLIKTNLESPVNAELQTTYQLTDVTANYYLIHGEGILASNTKASPGIINGMPVKYDMDGSMITDLQIDKTTGWVSEVKLKQIMKGTLQILDNPKVPGGLAIPMSFNTDVITTGK